MAEGDLVGSDGDGSTTTPVRPKRRRRRVAWTALAVVTVLLTGVGVAGKSFYYDDVPLPPLALPSATTIYYADGTTVLARVGEQARLTIDTSTLPSHVAAAVLSAEDRDFRRRGLLRGPSAIARQLARILGQLPTGASARLAVSAVKLERHLGKDRTLDLYLNAVYFGRDAYGIEAAALAYFNKPARDLTAQEAMVLAAVIRSPNDGRYDPGVRPESARQRWEYVRDGMVDPLSALDAATAAALSPPATLVPREQATPVLSGVDTPGGLTVHQIFQELRSLPRFGPNSSFDHRGGGYTIVSTIDPARQRAVERITDRGAPGSVLHRQPRKLSVAAVAVEPGTGRVQAYYGGPSGAAADHAGRTDLDPRNSVGGHPPGTSFAPYVLATALRSGISVRSAWPCEYRGNAGGSRRRAGDCTLAEAAERSYHGPLAAVTERVGPAKVLESARAAGIRSTWTDDDRHVDLTVGTSAGSAPGRTVRPEVGLGQYRITALDHANGMATFAAGGVHAPAHFVRSVTRAGVELHRESLRTSPLGLDKGQVADLSWALSRRADARLADGRPTALTTGSWPSPRSPQRNADAWAAGFTPQLAAAVWVGSDTGEPAVVVGAANLTGAGLPATVYREFLSAALAGVARAEFPAPAFGGAAPR